MHSKRNEKKHRIQLVTICGIIAITIIIAVVSLLHHYKPPKHDENAIAGSPNVDASYLYREINSDYGYAFLLAANLYQREDGSVNIYLTNPSDNNVDLLCEIVDEKSENTLYKSGRILPGEYIENIKAENEFENQSYDVIVHIYALEQSDYTSAGTTDVKLILQPW